MIENNEVVETKETFDEMMARLKKEQEAETLKNRIIHGVLIFLFGVGAICMLIGLYSSVLIGHALFFLLMTIIGIIVVGINVIGIIEA